MPITPNARKVWAAANEPLARASHVESHARSCACMRVTLNSVETEDHTG